MKIVDCVQGQGSWYAARMGVVTASEIDALVTPKWKVRTGDGVESYLTRKLAEKLLNWSPDQLQAFAVDQGKILETIAIPWYEFTYDTKVKRVGFCLSDDGRTGCSPDGLLPDGTGLEIKSPQPPNHIAYLLGGTVPDQYLPQVQFSIYVTGAPHWTFVTYNNQLPPLVVRVDRDEKAQAAIAEAVMLFNARFDAALAHINQLRS